MAASSSTHGAAVPGAKATAGWLYGPATDLLVGAGVGYVFSIPLLFVMSSVLDFGYWPMTVGAIFGLLVSGPHYGATILRVYDQREDRRKYAIFAVWITALLCGLFITALNVLIVGSILFTVYATWSPWHYSGQNYGIAVMFLRRRGIAIDPRAKRLLYTSFFLSFVLAFLVLHAKQSVVSYASIPISDASVYRFLSFGIPRPVLGVIVPVAALAYIGSIVGALFLLLREARLQDLVPVVCLVMVQALWFALPAALPLLVDVSLYGLAFTTVWISAAHSLQYLWVTSYYARGREASLGTGAYYWRALLAGWTVTIFPALIFAPGLLGSVPWDLGLAALLIAVVNLHHFVLDGAIWKLRDGPVARVLLRAAPLDSARASGVSWFRPAIAVLGVISLAVAVFDLWEREVRVNRAEGDLSVLTKSSERLAWIGRDAPSLRSHIAQVHAQQDRPDEAIAEYERSLELYPTAEAWIGVGEVHAGHGRWSEASDAFSEALELRPNNVRALGYSSLAWMELGRPDLARRALERARVLAPGNPTIERELERAIAAESGSS